MRDCRSALDSSAAWRASAGSMPAAGASASASVATRAALSATLPSFACQVTVARPSFIAESPCFMSSTKKNLASAKRGRITRS